MINLLLAFGQIEREWKLNDICLSTSPIALKCDASSRSEKVSSVWDWMNSSSRRMRFSISSSSNVIVISITGFVSERVEMVREYFLHSQTHHTLLTDVRKCVYECECRCTYTCVRACAYTCA